MLIISCPVIQCALRKFTRPDLFNVFINNLLYILPSKCTVAYVNDVTLVCSGNICTILTYMQSLLDTCYVWASSHRLKLNISKCFATYMPAATRVMSRDDLHLSQLTIDASPISRLDDKKILGHLHYDSKLI